MKKIFNKILLAFTMVMLFAACKKDVVLTYLDVVNFPPALTASAKTVVLNTNNNDSSVISFSWPAVAFKIKAPVTYKLQIDVPADTIGNSGWSNAYTIVVGDDVLGKSFSGKDLNALSLTTFKLVSDSMNTLVVRSVAVMDRTVYSNAVAVMVQPFKLIVKSLLYLPGDYQGWSPSTAATIAEATGKPKMFEGYLNIPSGGTYQFKMTPQADWTPTAYGDATGTSGNIIVANYAGGNMSVSKGAYYEFTADLNSNKWTATPTTWGILGDASPGGWNTDTQMTYDAANQVWKVTCNMLAGGSFKFRANNAWVIDFGVDGNNKLAYADNPFFGYKPGLNNLTVPSDGNYTITLDLHNSANYTFDLHKN